MERTNPVFNTAKMTLFQLTASGNEYAAAIAEKLGLNYENAQNSKSTKVSPEIAVLNNIILETRYLNRDGITQKASFNRITPAVSVYHRSCFLLLFCSYKGSGNKVSDLILP